MVTLEQICPYLGSIDDPDTAHSYPCAGNRCFHSKVMALSRLDYQGSICLGPDHATCNVFLGTQANPFLDIVRGTLSGNAKLRKVFNGILLAAGGLVLTVLMICLVPWQAWFASSEAGAAPVSQVYGSGIRARSTPTSMPTGTVSLSSFVQALLPNLETPVPETPTPIPYIARVLEVPIGKVIPLTIHRVREGESLERISQDYSTTVKAIKAINYYIHSPLLVDALVVVPANRTDVKNLPVFQAIQVVADTPVDELAASMKVDRIILEIYNQISEGEILKKGDWVLLPRIQ
jgi:hypothetical protein